MMTFREPVRRSALASLRISAPCHPRMVLFEPTVSVPRSLPSTWMTLGSTPVTWVCSSLMLRTTTGRALPPPVTPSPWVTQPTGGAFR